MISGLLDHDTYAYIHTDIIRKSSLGLHYIVVISFMVWCRCGVWWWYEGGGWLIFGGLIRCGQGHCIVLVSIFLWDFLMVG